MDGRVHPALLALNLAVEPQPASEMANSLEIIAAGGGSGKNCAFGSPIDSVEICTFVHSVGFAPTMSSILMTTNISQMG